MAPLALVTNWTTRLSHLHQLQNYPPDGATCISCKFGHQMAPLALVALPHCLGLPYWHYQLVLSLYLHQLESHQLSLHKWLSYLLTLGRHKKNRFFLGKSPKLWVGGVRCLGLFPKKNRFFF